MLNVAKENNLAETAFCMRSMTNSEVEADAVYDIRPESKNEYQIKI